MCSSDLVEARQKALSVALGSALVGVVWAVAVVTAVDELGISISAFVATATVIGGAVAFGAQQLTRDVIAGFFVLAEDQYGVGDVITVNTGQLSGGVERLNLRVTALRALDGTVHIIPNGQIATVSVSSKDWSRVVAQVDVTYAANIDDALRVLEQVSSEIYEADEWKHFFLEAPEQQGVTQLAPDGVTLRALADAPHAARLEALRTYEDRIGHHAVHEDAARDGAGEFDAHVSVIALDDQGR